MRKRTCLEGLWVRLECGTDFYLKTLRTVGGYESASQYIVSMGQQLESARIYLCLTRSFRVDKAITRKITEY